MCALSALFAFSKGWTRQVPVDNKGGLVLLFVGLAAAASAQMANRLLVRIVAAVAVVLATYLFIRFGHSAAFDGGAAAAVVLLGLAVALIGATFVASSVETSAPDPHQAN